MEDNLYIECGNCWTLLPYCDRAKLTECPHCNAKLGGFIKAVIREEPSEEQQEWIKNNQ